MIPIVRSHHERWDGKGYPDKLVGEAIPLLARIVAVADTFDAMTSNRPYHADKKGKPPEVAFEEVRKQAGFQFDPQCARGVPRNSEGYPGVNEQQPPDGVLAGAIGFGQMKRRHG